jgi:hypothetical protein
MQESLRNFTSSSERSEERVPNRSRLYPRHEVSSLPLKAGGLSAPDLASHIGGMQAKTVAQLFGFGKQPWKVFLSSALKHAANDPRIGPAWVVTHPEPNLIAHISPLWRGPATMFASLKSHRLIPPSGQTFHSILTEPIFLNRQIRLAAADNTSPPLQPRNTPPTPSTWRQLKHLRLAHQQQSALSEADRDALSWILYRLPEAWRTAVTRADTPRSDWLITTPTDAEVPIVQERSGGFYMVLPNMRLHPLQGAPGYMLLPQGLNAEELSRPAAVFLREKPKTAWSKQEWEAWEAQADLAPQDREPPMEPWLLGAWDELELDPCVWGLGEDPLLGYTVQAARCRLLHLQALQAPVGKVPGYRAAGAVRPAVWYEAGAPVQDPLEIHLGDIPPRFAAESGLSGLEASWRASVTTRTPPHTGAAGGAGSSSRPRTADFDIMHNAPPWLALSPPRPPRPSLDARVAARTAAAAAALALQPNGGHRRRLEVLDDTVDAAGGNTSGQRKHPFKTAWARLLDKTLDRAHRVTCYRIMHGVLGCNAFICHKRPDMPRASAMCPHASCEGVAGEAAIETLTHAFMDCPTVRPAVTWLLDVWQAVSGERPPRSAAVIIADDHRVWAPRHKYAARLWSRLRVAFLGCLWERRCARHRLTSGSSFAAHVAVATITALRTAITRDWRRTGGDVRSQTLGPTFCHEWFRGRDPALKLEQFVELWATPTFFCDIINGRLNILLSANAPVPLPT